MTKYIDLTPDDVENVMRRNRMKINDDVVMDAYYSLDFSVLNKFATSFLDLDNNKEQQEALFSEIEIQLRERKFIS